MSNLVDGYGNPIRPNARKGKLIQPKPQRPLKVMIAVPTRDDLKAGFAFDLANLVGMTAFHRRDIHVSMSFDKGTLIAVQRQALAQVAIEQDEDFILWLDSDMRFPPNTLVRLLSHRKPIVAANYTERRAEPPSPRPVAFLSDQNMDQRLYTRDGDTGLVQVASIGMGVMLTAVEVFRKTPQPWFGHHWNGKSWGGEDIWFARSVREAGFPVLVDQDLSHAISHIGEFEFHHSMVALPEEAEQQDGDNHLLGAEERAVELAEQG